MTGTGEGQFFRFWPLAGVRHGISPSEVGMFRAIFEMTFGLMDPGIQSDGDGDCHGIRCMDPC